MILCLQPSLQTVSGSFQELIFLDCFGDPQSYTLHVFHPQARPAVPSQPGRLWAGKGHSEQVTFQGDGWIGNGWVGGWMDGSLKGAG